jgi:phosphoribosyl 1,2-cyclic phosphodiesterase
VITFSLQSGSNGNCIYVEAGDVRLLFDAGISAREAAARMACHGRDIRDCHALIISHDHVDHTRAAGTFHRRFRLPLYLSARVHRAVAPRLGPIHDPHHYRPGQSLRFGRVVVHTLPTPHDGIDTVCFVVEHERRRLGIMTDLGFPFPALADALREIDAAYLESNYDEHLLRNGPYTESLKRRIIGDGGHLSNDESADLAGRTLSPRTKWLTVAHLSEQNNRPELAFEAHRLRVGRTLPLHVASRYEVGKLLEL